jgi:Fe-S-cluster containining protein
MSLGELRAAHAIHPVAEGRKNEKGLFILDPGDASCPFHRSEIGCTIYESRPTQCRTWPFWPEVVRKKQSWDRAARECEGMNQGKVVTTVEIEALLRTCVEAGLPEDDPW